MSLRIVVFFVLASSLFAELREEPCFRARVRSIQSGGLGRIGSFL